MHTPIAYHIKNKKRHQLPVCLQREKIQIQVLPLRSMHSLVLSQCSEIPYKLSSDIQELLCSWATLCTGVCACANTGSFFPQVRFSQYTSEESLTIKATLHVLPRPNRPRTCSTGAINAQALNFEIWVSKNTNPAPINLIKARFSKKPVFTWENVSHWQVSTWLQNTGEGQTLILVILLFLLSRCSHNPLTHMCQVCLIFRLLSPFYKSSTIII